MVQILTIVLATVLVGSGILVWVIDHNFLVILNGRCIYKLI
jgi:hypothetical protein